MKYYKIAYWVTTALLSFMMLASAARHIFKAADMEALYMSLGHPAHLVLPVAIAKILAVVAILSRKSHTLMEWAYAGLFFELVIAFMAHIAIPDKEWLGSLVGLILVMSSYFLQRKVFFKSTSQA